MSEPPPYDQTPAYSASLEFYGFAFVKTELDTPWNNHSGSLRPVVVELNSNQLKLYDLAVDKSVISALRALFLHQNYQEKEEPRSSCDDSNYTFDGDAYGDDNYGELRQGVFSKIRTRYTNKKVRKKLRAPLPPALLDNSLLLEPTSSSDVYARFASRYRGLLLRSFTLLNLVVGEAPSCNLQHYKEDSSTSNTFALLKYRNVLRLRVEYSQLLLHFWSFYGMVHWYRNLCIGRDLASLLDTRSVGVLKSIPRSYSPQNNAFFESSGTFSDWKRRDSFASETSLSTFLGSDSGSDASESLYSEQREPLKLHVVVYGQKIVCYEDLYSPLEKQYISNCMAVLNSFDKWVGRKLTISNYEYMLPKNDAYNVNEGNQIYISLQTFNSLARNYSKIAKSKPCTVSPCMDFFVESTGLVSVGV